MYSLDSPFPFYESSLSDGKLPKIRRETLSASEVVSLGFSVKYSPRIRELLTKKFFLEREKHSQTLEEHVPILKKVFGTDLPNKSEKAKEPISTKLFIKELALKINHEADKIQNYSELKDKDIIIGAANQYLDCRNALSILNDPLVAYYFREHPALLQRNRSNAKDLIQHARIGLMRAIDRFIPDRNCRFSSFAMPCIHTNLQTVIPSIDSIVAYSSTTGNTIAKLKESLSKEQAATGINNIEKVAEEFHIQPQTVERLIRASSRAIPFSEFDRGNSKDVRMVDTIPDLGKTPDEEVMIREETHKKKLFITTELQPLIKKLNKKEQYILAAFYGLIPGEEPKSYREIAKELSPNNPPPRQAVEQMSRVARRKVLRMANRNPDLMKRISELFFNGKEIPNLGFIRK